MCVDAVCVFFKYVIYSLSFIALKDWHSISLYMYNDKDIQTIQIMGCTYLFSPGFLMLVYVFRENDYILKFQYYSVVY